ncbi:MAG: hypothetical protein KF774_11225 [Planctomyces sp.]|nr:hypothetical protein [Planctomyces sp.]
MRVVVCAWLLAGAIPCLLPAQESTSAAGSALRLLRSGRVPESRLGSIVEIVGTRGNEEDLGYLFERAAGRDWPLDVRKRAFVLLLDAAQNRKVLPRADLAALVPLVSDAEQDAGLRLAAVRFAGAAASPDLAEPLAALARNSEAPEPLRAAALESLAAAGGETAKEAVTELLQADQPFRIRALAAGALAQQDLPAAAAAAAELLSSAQPEDAIPIVLDGMLARRGGTEQLASALGESSVSADVAKVALRHMYSVGRSDEALVESLGRAAGLDSDPPPLTDEEFQALVNDIREHGDPVRGEDVFRRADLSCMKCHAVSAAGGQVGPDLSAVGSISPIDFLLNSVLLPDQAIKEAYITRVVATVDGEVLQGIVVDRSDERLVLKDATGAIQTVAIEDIEEEVEGKSLMPKGLVRFMTRGELVDLVSFLSQLGRPGDFAIRSTPRFQRYRVLTAPPEEFVDSAPNDEQFEASILRSESWAPIYARANGTAPLDEAVQASGSPVVYLAAEFDVIEAGLIGVKIDSAEGVAAWLNDDSLALTPETKIEASAGRHRITLRVDTRARSLPGVVLELVRQSGSSAEFQPVDGA